MHRTRLPLTRSPVRILATCGLAVFVLAWAPLAAQQAAAPAFDHAHATWTEVLQTCVRDGGFDYAKLKRDRSKLDAYLAALRAVTPETLAGWNEKQRFAFWINTYNAFCIQKVIDNYPLKSIRRLDGAFGINTVFDKGFIPLKAHHPDGKDDELALNDIEHGILRKRFKDARLHAAINCASASCPPLRAEAYTAEELDQQLEEQMRAFVDDPARNRIDPAKKELEISEIFKWFAEDFERDARSVKEYLIRFAPPEKAEFIRSAKIRYLDYDWDLNDVPK
jgi:hypothetical protein